MATSVLILVGVSVLVLFLQMEIYSAITIDINPKRFTGDNENEVNISCTCDRADIAAKEVMLLKISRKGEKAIATIHSNNSITYAHGNSEEFPATGKIDKTVTKSYLRMTIKEPNTEDTGTYTCTVFFMDEMGVMVEDKSTGYLTVDDPGIKMLKEMVKSLTRKANKGEKLIFQYKIRSNQFQKALKDLETKSKIQTKQMSNMIKLEQKNSGSISTIVSDMASQKEKPSDSKVQDSFNNSEISQMKDDFKLQEKKISNLLTKQDEYKKVISDMQDNANSQSKQISTLLKKVDDFTTQLKNIESQSSNTSDKISNLVKKGAEVDFKLSEASQKTNRLSAQIKKIQRGRTPMTAFSATNHHTFVKAKSGFDLVFPDVIFQEGQGYDPKTGIFTAPADGWYAFHLVLKLSCSGCRVRAQIMARLKVLVKVEVGLKDDEEQGAVSALARLSVGDEVVCRTDYASPEAIIAISQLSVFTGYLINADST